MAILRENDLTPFGKGLTTTGVVVLVGAALRNPLAGQAPPPFAFTITVVGSSSS